jgi:hypothetical protein
MTPRKRPASQAPYQPGQLLDWRSPAHWSWEDLPCRYCSRDTPLRDSKGKPAHKVCAEAALARQRAEAADAYQNGHLAS